MQIGNRWVAGSEPHSSVPESVRAAVIEVDRADASGSWTLTWLEGRPVCTRTDGTVVTINRAGDVAILSPDTEGRRDIDGAWDEDDDWLAEK